MTAPARSLTSGFTPLSITATVTPPPRVSCQAAGTFIMFRTHCWSPRMVSAAAAVPGSTASDAAQPSTARTALPRRPGPQPPTAGPPAGQPPTAGPPAGQPPAAQLPAAQPPAGQHPGVPGQCGLAGGAASVPATDWATLLARLVISA